MKNSILTVAALFCFSLSIKAQHLVNGCMVTLIESYDNSFSVKKDTIEVKFNPNEYAWGAKITNNSAKDITVIWDKSTFILNGQASKVIFANTLKMNIDNIIPNQDIAAGSFIQKDIAPVGIFTKRYAEPTINRKQIKKDFEATGKPHTAKIRLAFLIDGQEKKYDFNFTMVPAKKK